MSVNVTYSHAAPFIRQQLVYAIYAADNARTQRDRQAKYAQAYAYAQALSIMARSGDQTLVEGIADEENLPHRALKLTREWLKDDATLVLGIQEPL